MMLKDLKVIASLFLTIGLLMSCEEVPEINYEIENTDTVTMQTTIPSAKPAKQPKSTIVYICTGNQSKSYHFSPSCSALGQCAGDVEEIEIGEVESRDRTDPCNMCAGGN
jgi:hypothetical protein